MRNFKFSKLNKALHSRRTPFGYNPFVIFFPSKAIGIFSDISTILSYKSQVWLPANPATWTFTTSPTPTKSHERSKFPSGKHSLCHYQPSNSLYTVVHGKHVGKQRDKSFMVISYFFFFFWHVDESSQATCNLRPCIYATNWNIIRKRVYKRRAVRRDVAERKYCQYRYLRF